MNNEIFAQGLCFYKLFCTFVIGAVIGDMVETIKRDIDRRKDRRM